MQALDVEFGKTLLFLVVMAPCIGTSANDMEHVLTSTLCRVLLPYLTIFLR